MYVSDSQACNLPNSESPMSPAAVAAQDAFIASVGSSFSNGNNTLSGIMTALGGNPLAVPGSDPTVAALVAGNSGVPTTGAGGFPFFPGPGSRNRRWGGRGAGAGGNGGARTAAMTPCTTPPIVVPLVTVVPVPALTRQVPTTGPTPAKITTPPPPAPVAPSKPKISQSDCRTGNICLDLANGCVASYQVDPAQLLACSKAGYNANRNLYAGVIDTTNLPFLGFPMPNPPPFDPSMLSQHPGLSGLGDDDSGPSWGIWAVVILGLVVVGSHIPAPKKGRR